MGVALTRIEAASLAALLTIYGDDDLYRSPAHLPPHAEQPGFTGVTPFGVRR